MTRRMTRTLMLSSLFALHLFALDLVSAQDQFFDSNGVRIRYVDQGSGPPVVLLEQWQLQAVARLGVLAVGLMIKTDEVSEQFLSRVAG